MIELLTQETPIIDAVNRAQENLNTPPLLIWMTETYRELPAGVILSLPRDVSLRLIQMRKATPCGSFTAYADAAFGTEDELKTLRISHLMQDRECHL